MYKSQNFEKRLIGFSLSILVFLFLVFLDKYLGLTNHAFDVRPEFWKVIIREVLWKIPMFIVLYWLSIDHSNKTPILVAFAVIIGFLLVKLSLLSGTEGLRYGSMWFWLDLLGLISGFSLFGYLKTKHLNGLFLGVIPIVSYGFGQAFNAFSYLDIWDQGLGYVGLHRLLSRMDYAEYAFFINYFILCLSYIPIFIIGSRIYAYVLKPKSFNKSFTRIDLFEKKLSKLSFSLIFWSFRICLFVLLFNSFEYFYYKESFSYQLIFRMLICSLAIFIFVSIYRNFLVKYIVDSGRYPAWQFLGLNIPVINIFVWMSAIFSDSKEPKFGVIIGDEDLLDDKISISDIKDVSELKHGFLKNQKNQSIKVLVVTLLILNLLLSIFLVDGMGNSEMMVTVLITSAITVVITAWYLTHYLATFILSGLVVFLALAVIVFDVGESDPVSILISMINIVLYFSLFHFDKMEFYLPSKKLEKLEED